MERRCRLCGMVKAIAEFGRNCTYKDGWDRRCKDCINANRRAYRSANLEGKRTYHREYTRAHAAELNAIRREKNSADPEPARAYFRAYRLKNKDRIRANWERWSAEHPESKRLYEKIYHHRKRTTEGTFSPADIRALYQQQAGLCAYCCCALGDRYDIEHKMPLSRGGTNWPSNLCLACHSCNAMKNNKTPEEFAAYQAALPPSSRSFPDTQA